MIYLNIDVQIVNVIGVVKNALERELFWRNHSLNVKIINQSMDLMSAPKIVRNVKEVKIVRTCLIVLRVLMAALENY